MSYVDCLEINRGKVNELSKVNQSREALIEFYSRDNYGYEEGKIYYFIVGKLLKKLLNFSQQDNLV